jgi:general secretion pathway protein A
LKLPQLRQLRQRIMLRCHTSAFNKEQTADYIRERLRIAGANSEPIFSPKSIDTVHLYSLGIPRVINLLCEHSLVTAIAEHQRPVLPETVEEIAREFQLDEVSPVAGESEYINTDVYNSEAFLQNLGEALSKFRPGMPSSRGRK